MPGYHKINTFLNKVIIVPTHYIELEWTNRTEKNDEDYDANLKALELSSKDKFDFEVELTQKFYVNGKEASKMIEKLYSEGGEDEVNKYGSIRGLISRALEPLITSHFRIAAQENMVLEFQSKRGEIQDKAEAYIKNALKKFGVEAVGTHINNVNLPTDLVKHVRSKSEKLAELDAREVDLRIAEKDEQIKRLEIDTETYKQEEYIRIMGGIDMVMKTKIIEMIPQISVPTISINSDFGKDIINTFTGLLVGNQVSNPNLIIQLQDILEDGNSESKKTRLIELISKSDIDSSKITKFLDKFKSGSDSEE